MSIDNHVDITVGEVKGLYADLNEKLASDNGRDWMEAFKLFLKKQNPWPEVLEQVVAKVVEKAKVATSFLKKLGSYSIGPLAQKKTGDCFLGSQFYHRDGDLDSWLPKIQQETGPAYAVSHELTREMTFIQMVQSLYGTVEDGVAALSKMIVETGDNFTTTQIDLFIERTDAGEATGLLTNGYANLFPVLNKDGKTVSVVHAYRDDDGQWYICVNRLDFDRRWLAGHRFFSRNTGTV